MNVEGIMLSERTTYKKKGQWTHYATRGANSNPERRRQKEQFITVTTASEQKGEASFHSGEVQAVGWGGKRSQTRWVFTRMQLRQVRGIQRPGKCKLSCHCSFRSRWSNRDQIFSPKQLENGQNKHLQSTGYEAVKDRDLW